jgi:Flp pilus assembly pilin Flp
VDVSIGDQQYAKEHTKMVVFLVRLLRNECGVAAIDFGLIATLIAVAGVAVLRALGPILVNVL